MAVKYVCENKDCNNFGNEVSFTSISYVMRNGKLVPKETLTCPVCGQVLSEVKVVESGPINVQFNRFNSLSPQDKKAWIMKRNEQVKKKDAELKEHYTNKVLGIEK